MPFFLERKRGKKTITLEVQTPLLIGWVLKHYFRRGLSRNHHFEMVAKGFQGKCGIIHVWTSIQIWFAVASPKKNRLNCTCHHTMVLSCKSAKGVKKLRRNGRKKRRQSHRSWRVLYYLNLPIHIGIFHDFPIRHKKGTLWNTQDFVECQPRVAGTLLTCYGLKQFALDIIPGNWWTSIRIKAGLPIGWCETTS